MMLGVCQTILHTVELLQLLTQYTTTSHNRYKNLCDQPTGLLLPHEMQSQNLPRGKICVFHKKDSGSWGLGKYPSGRQSDIQQETQG
jgi:hypothetical protein